MAETATQERANAVTVTDAGPSRKKISIEIPAQTVSEKLNESLDTLMVEAAVPGFRKGRAPRGLIQKKFGAALRSEAKQQLVADAYTKAVEEHKLKVVGEPAADQLDSVEVVDGKPLAFELEVEVMPEFELPPLDGITVKRPLLEVTEDMVSDELRKITINEGRLEERQSAEPGDYLTGRGIMKLRDGEEIYNIDGAVVQVPASGKDGKGMILGILVDDFASQLGLPGPGQTVTIKATGPEHHEVERVRGAPLTMTFEVQRVDRIIPAEMADVLAGFGMAGEDQLREAVRARMQQRVHVQQQAVMRQQVGAHLVDNTTMELPERLTASQAARAVERQRLELLYRGIEPQQVEQRIAEARAGTQAAAVRELKLFFILARIAEEQKVEVTEAEANGRIAQLAVERNMRPEALRQEIIQRNQAGTIVQQIREHKTLDAILARANITDISAEEFNREAKGREGAQA